MVFGSKQGNKDNSKRRFPGTGGRRNNPVYMATRKKEALERNEAWAKLSLVQQLKSLDSGLTSDGFRKRQPGECKKQRAKIAARMERSKSRPTQVPPKALEAMQPTGGERVKAKDRHAQERKDRPGK